MLGRRLHDMAVIAVLLAAFAILSGALPAAAQQQGEVRLGHNRAWGNPALLIGITQGYFKRQGVTVTEKNFNNPADIVSAIATGDLDAGVCPTGVLLTARSRGVRVKAVALAQGSHNPPVAYMVRRDSGITTVNDLRGKTAGIAGFGGTGDLYLRYWLTKSGINPATDLKLTFVPFQLTLPALINNQIAIGLVNSVLGVTADEHYPGQLKTLFTYVDVTRDAIGNDHTNALLLVFGDAFVKRDRPTAVHFLEAYLQAIRAIEADPKKAIVEWAEASDNNAIRELKKPVTLPSDGKVYRDAFQFEAKLALQFGYLKSPADVNAAIDDSLLDEAAHDLSHPSNEAAAPKKL